LAANSEIWWQTLVFSWLKPVYRNTAYFSGTGFSREEAGVSTINLAAWRLTPSRLKPVPQNEFMLSVGLALAGKRPV